MANRNNNIKTEETSCKSNVPVKREPKNETTPNIPTTDKSKKESYSFINCSFGCVTLCIGWLTFLASVILICNHCSHNTSDLLADSTPVICDSVSSVLGTHNAINYYADSTDLSAIDVDQHRISNTEVNVSDPSGLLDSIIYNLTLAVNSINNVLTSGSILIAILTLFIALVGIFAYHDLKSDVKNNIDRERINLESFQEQISEQIESAKTARGSFENTIKEDIIRIDNKIDDCCKEAKQKMQSLEITQIKQEHYFRKSIDYLYTITTCLLEKTGDTALRDLTYHDYNINTLYSYVIDEDNKESAWILQDKKEALQILKETGVSEDIKDLEYISENDANEDIKKLSREVIGIIKKRFGIS